MAYTPKTWECGDTITANDLNHIEQGIEDCCGSGSEPLMVHITKSNEYDPETEQDVTVYEYSKTGAEILEALLNHKSVIFHETFDGNSVEWWYYPTFLEPNGADVPVTHWMLQIGTFSYSTRAYVMGFTVYQIFIDDGEITATVPYDALV